MFVFSKTEVWKLTLWLIFFINPLVDAITGYLVLSGTIAQGGLGSPSQLFRLFLSVLMLIQIRQPTHLIYVLLFIFYLVALELFNFLFHGDVSGLSVGITYSYKTAFGLLMYYVIDKYIKEKLLPLQKIIDWIILSGVIYSLIVLISNIGGFSFGSYGDTLGSRGIFASANGLGIYVGICSLLVIYRYHNQPNKKCILYYVLMSYVMLGLMTRAAVGLFFIGLFLWFLRFPLKYKLPVLIVAGIMVWILWSPISKVIIASTEMISYRYFTSDASLHSLFIGGRQYLFDRASAQFVTDGALWYRIVIGGGYFLSFRNPFNLDYSISSILEADLWDVFYMFGIVGLLAYAGLFFYGLSFSGGKNGGANYILKIAWIMLFLHSALAGHVLQNGMSVMILVCVLIILKYRSRNESTFPVS